jgi:transposase
LTYGLPQMRRRPTPARGPTDPKLEALREQGTVNPRPEDVHDPVFLQSEFFDPRDLIQVRYEMLRRVQVEGQPVGVTARSFGVSRPTFYNTRAQFEQQGLTGLLPAKRGPHGPHKVTGAVLEFIQCLLAEEPGLDPAALAERVEREKGLHVHPRTIGSRRFPELIRVR